MAKSRSTNTLVKFIRNSINRLYQNTYYSQPDTKLNLDKIKTDIDNSLNKLTDITKTTYGLDSISDLYSRLNKDSSMGDDIDKMLSNKTLVEGLFLSSYTDNKNIKEADNEIDAICKYMPKLLDALKAKQDNVLSSDHFSKDFLNTKNLSSTDDSFKEKIKELKKKYKLIDVVNEAYEDTSKYGEKFLYVVPYKKALQKLLKTKGIYDNYAGQQISSEAQIEKAFSSISTITYNFSKHQIISESGNLSMIKEKELNNIDVSSLPSIKVEFNNTSILESAFMETYTTRKVKMNQGKSVPDDISFQGLDSAESLYNTSDKNNSEDKINVPGCIIKSIPRENVIPLYMDNMCLGYYCVENDMDEFFPKGGSIDPMLSLRNGNFEISDASKKDTLLKYLSSSLSKQIDAKFINANQNLTKEIYTVLKSNELLNSSAINKLRITYIPPSDMMHWYWKKDPKTNRGISDLDKSLLAAKLYVGLKTANITGYLTRGFDRRVYYVRQGIERNISKTLINVINQIKKSNYNAREMTNLKHILNMQGKYNDFVIPLSSTGEPPIQFEIMPGQQIDLQTDFLNMLEEEAVSATDVPYEYVQSRQTVDYAIRLTMASGRFIKTTYTRQALVEELSSELLTKVWNAEYDNEDTLEVTLPPPAYLNMINTTTMLENSNQLISNILETEGDPDNNKYNTLLSKNLKRDYLSTYIDFDKIDKIKKATMMELKQQESKDQQQ